MGAPSLNPADAAHPLSGYLDRLPELDGLLRAADMPCGPDRWVNIHDLLLRLAQEDRLPEGPEELRRYLVPLLCRSAEDIERFQAIYHDWVGQRRPVRDSVSPALGTQTAANRDTLHNIKWPRWWWVGIPVLLLLLGLAYASWHYGWFDPPPEAPPSDPDEIQTRKPPEPDKQGLPELSLQAVPVRRPLEPLRLNADDEKRLANRDVWLPWPIPFLIASILAWRWLRRRFVLKHARQDPRDPLAKLRLADVHADLFDDPKTRAALRRLHNPVAYQGRRLDVKATIHHTLKNGGLFTPVAEQLRSVPEVLMLLDSRHEHDHYAALGEMVAERIRGLGLELTLFRYAGAPDRLQDEQGNWQTISPADLGRRYPRARLILIGDPHILLAASGRDLSVWADQLTVWPDRGLLATRNVAADVKDLLTLAGLQFSPFTAEGVRTLSARLSGLAQGQRPDPLPPLPRILRDEYLWKSAFAPDRDVRLAFLAALRHYLGGPGLLVFSAMAAYPGLNWNLTRALDISLLPGRMNAGEREHRLLRLAQLPGCRQGRLPDWLREALQEQLTEGQRERVRKLYHELFTRTAGEDEPAIELPLAVPRALPGLLAGWRERFGRRGRRLREYLHDLLRGEDQGWEDRIFANLLLGGRMSRLDFVLPRWLNRYLPGWNWLGTARPLVGAIALAILSYLAVQQLWQQWLREPYRASLVGEQKVAFSAYTLFLTAAPGLNELADSLQNTLSEHGFNLPPVEALSGDGSDGINRLRVGPEVPDAVTRYIASRLSYLTYGGPVEIETEPLDGNPVNNKRIEVSINAAGRTGNPFRDEFVRELALDERDRFAKGPAAFDVPKAPAKPSTFLRRFRDDLNVNDGGQGPEMVVLPAGSFEMGCVSGIDCNDDELPVHQVTLPSFAIGRSEVTFADYERFAAASKRELPDDEGWGRGNRPVINVSWRDARAYAAWLSEQTGQLYRLPSEAEWEYAARAGTRTPFALPAPDGSDQIAGKALANCRGCGSQWDSKQTAPVASFAANAWGLHDLHGNVWEWVQDCWVDNYEQALADGSARGANDKGECSRVVLRGGGWDTEPETSGPPSAAG